MLLRDENDLDFDGVGLGQVAAAPQPPEDAPLDLPDAKALSIEDQLAHLKDQQAQADKQKAYLGIFGKAAQGVVNRPSAYELFFNKQSARPDVAGVADAAAQGIQDPLTREQKAFAYLKAKNDANKSAGEMDFVSRLKDDNSATAKAFKQTLISGGMDPSAINGATAFDLYSQGFSPAKMGEIKAKAAVDSANRMREIEAGKNADFSKMERSKNMDLERAKALKDLEGTPAEAGVDRDFAKTYADWYASGGRASVEKNLNQLSGAIDTLSKNPDLTGGISTRIPGLSSDGAQATFNPQMIEVRDKIRGAVQNTLRQTLGAQFTEKEGEAIFNRAFNPMLSAKENVARATAVLNELKQQAADKEASAKYYEAHRTLRGYKPATADAGREKDVQEYALKHGISYEQAMNVKRARQSQAANNE